ncbi:sensor histidine kinase [uncultured Clostridium sp.]|uniref:sensor histidine kinase n=1 Tax=uncultured Clostridium sp. TaxID=59620 RepID=UPI0028EC3D2C|nr:sensor histidine kinase [uncultured Clostridium sp.]
MVNNNIKLKTKIVYLSFAVVFISLAITVVFMSQLRMSWVRKEMEINLMNTTKILSKSPMVIEILKDKGEKEPLQKYIKDIAVSSKNIDQIAIMDLSGNTYANSNLEEIGTSEDISIGEEAALKNNIYLKDMIENFGRLIITFVPVRDENNLPVGYVTAKVTMKSIETYNYEILVAIILVVTSGLMIGAVSSLIISNSIKNSLLGYEAEQISKLFIQKQEVLDSLDEGIVAVDENLKITLYNRAAIEILGGKEDIIGEDVFKLIPNSNLPEVFLSGEAQYNKEMIINDTIILTNRIPILEKEKVIGAVTIFRDKTELTRLAEEVTGIKQVVEALRANNHEFLNKLHVILGLIHIGETDEAKRYIIKQTKIHQQKTSIVINRIKDSTVAALMLGKISRAKEMGVDLSINPKSTLNKCGGKINSHNIVTIVGNLLENAIEAVSITEKDEKNVEILILESDKSILIKVIDTGDGIEKENIKYVFNSGFSTKGENRGRGLFMVKRILDNLKGEIYFFTEPTKGSEVKVIIPKGD